MPKNNNNTLVEALMAEEARVSKRFNHDLFVEDLAKRIDGNVRALVQSGAILNIEGNAIATYSESKASVTFKLVSVRARSYYTESGHNERLPDDAQINLTLIPFKPTRAPFLLSGARRLGKRIQAQGPKEIVERNWRFVAEALAKSDAILRETLGRSHDLTPLAELVSADPGSPLAEMTPADMAIFDAARRAAVDTVVATQGPRGIFVKMAALFQARITQAQSEQALSFNRIRVTENFSSEGISGPIYFRCCSAIDGDGNDVTGVALCLDVHPFGSGMRALVARAQLSIMGPDAFIEKIWAKASRQLAQIDAEMRLKHRLSAPPGLRSLFERKALAESCPAAPPPGSASKPRAPRSL